VKNLTNLAMRAGVLPSLSSATAPEWEIAISDSDKHLSMAHANFYPQLYSHTPKTFDAAASKGEKRQKVCHIDKRTAPKPAN